MSRTRPSCGIVAVGAALATFGVLERPAEAGPFFLGLGTLGGSQSSSYAWGLSKDGGVVVGTSWYQNRLEAFRWTLETGMVGLGDLPGGGFTSSATDASRNGSVVVGIGADERGISAFRWTAAEGMSSISNIESGFRATNATAVTRDGSVIFGTGVFDNGRLEMPYRWNLESGAEGLGVLPGRTGGATYGVSDDGRVVVGASGQGDSLEAFRWTAETGMVGLGVLPDTTWSVATAVTSDGRMILGVSGNTAVIWNEDAGPIELVAGFIPRDASQDVSMIVGTATDETHAAAIWRENSGLQTISDLLRNDLGLDLGGWQLTAAAGISADGTIIAGRGINPAGDDEAWIAAIPEPTTLVLLGVCSLLICRRRSRAHPPHGQDRLLLSESRRWRRRAGRSILIRSDASHHGVAIAIFLIWTHGAG